MTKWNYYLMIGLAITFFLLLFPFNSRGEVSSNISIPIPYSYLGDVGIGSLYDFLIGTDHCYLIVDANSSSLDCSPIGL